MRRHVLLTLALVVIASIVLSACAPAQAAEMASAQTSSKMTVAALPQAMQDAPARVRAAYQFALTNPDALENVPCYCGCGAMGHTSNLSCYIKNGAAGGQVTFEEHALGCSLCVDIAQDVMQMTAEGKSPQDIHSTVVAAFGKFGPGNQ